MAEAANASPSVMFRHRALAAAERGEGLTPRRRRLGAKCQGFWRQEFRMKRGSASWMHAGEKSKRIAVIPNRMNGSHRPVLDRAEG